MLDVTSQIPQCCAVGLARAAESMVRALGGCAVTLLFPMLTPPDEQCVPGLGLESPSMQQIEIAPVAILSLASRSSLAAARLEILIPGSAVFMTMAERLAATPQALFDSALGIIHEARLLRIESWTAEQFAGSPYMFRLIVQG
jgi:hypothetical protein